MEKIPQQPKSEKSDQTELSEGVPGFVEIEEIPIDENSILNLLNVRHIRSTLEQYKHEIDTHLNDAKVLVSELAIFEKDTEAGDLTEMEAFYSYITNSAQERGLKMIVADPEKKLSQAIVNRAVSMVPGLAALGSGAHLVKKINDITENIYEKKRHEKYYRETSAGNAEITRRNFLKAGAAATVTVAGGLHFTAGTAEEVGISAEKGKLLETFLLDSLDYRNALVAKQILKLSEDYSTVSAVYGLAHAPGIKKFLANPELLEQKLSVYEKTYDLFNDEDPDVYNFEDNRAQ